MTEKGAKRFLTRPSNVEGDDEEEPDMDPWEESKKKTAHFRLLATTPFLQEEQGIEVLFLGQTITFIDSPGSSTNLVSRQEQRDAIDLAFKMSRDRLKDKAIIETRRDGLCIALRGSPGIGKSWSSLLYIRKLMNQTETRRPIVFESGPNPHSRVTHLIMPESEQNGGWKVYELRKGKYIDEWKRFKKLDVVIDPAQFPSGETPSPSIWIGAAGHTFIPASTDNAHLGAWQKLFTATYNLILGPYSEAELMVAYPYMIFSDPKKQEENEPESIDNASKTLKKNYRRFGGLPRYMSEEQARWRSLEMTRSNAMKHSEKLLRALSEPESLHDEMKIASLFFTIRPGKNEDGVLDPLQQYAVVEFVSAGAVKAAGKVVYESIQRMVKQRTLDDSSNIGLAFERVVLALLQYGTVGMKELGISTRCKELVKDGEEEGQDLEFVQAPRLSIGNAPCRDEAEFISVLKALGPSHELSHNKLECKQGVTNAPTGYANVDGMSGIDVGDQITLQAGHAVLGHKYIEQRQLLGLVAGKIYVLVFFVPPERYAQWKKFQNFSWRQEESTPDAAENSGKVVAGKKRRFATLSASTSKATNITEAAKSRARKNLRQFVVTLDIDDESALVQMVRAGLCPFVDSMNMLGLTFCFNFQKNGVVNGILRLAPQTLLANLPEKIRDYLLG